MREETFQDFLKRTNLSELYKSIIVLLVSNFPSLENDLTGLQHAKNSKGDDSFFSADFLTQQGIFSNLFDVFLRIEFCKYHDNNLYWGNVHLHFSEDRKFLGILYIDKDDLSLRFNENLILRQYRRNHCN